MKGELISIIVLVYNTDQYVNKCLKSILNQTYSNLEVIVINDGSTDRSSKKINAIASNDKRIKVIERENKGRYLSRLEGYKKAKGKYIFYLDGDDWIKKDTIEKMYDAMKETKADVVRCQYQKYVNNHIITPKSYLNRNVLMDIEHLEPQFFDLLYKTNYCNTICKQLMKKSVMKDIKDVEEELNYCEDLACNLKIYKNMKSILFMPDELYIYNFNHSYKKRRLSKAEVMKKIEDTIYVYYDLYMTTKEFDIKNKKEYKKVAAMRMIEKLSILVCDLLKTGISKKEFIDTLENIIMDKKVKAIYKELDKEDTSDVYKDVRVYDLTKRVIKNSDYMLNKKFAQLYNYNKLFLNFKKIF
ncbi:MAG: glycosyltransferase [Bacilli bacterium]|nr:glycosyltransferase [Bacilli bacterium]